MSGTLSPGGGYRTDWLERYDRADGEDAAILNAELSVVNRWFERTAHRCGGEELLHLDLGTCTGRYLRWSLGQGFASAHGVDRSPDAVDRCSKSLLGRPARVHHADFLEPGYLAALAERHGPFDLVTMMLGTINHLTAAQQRDAVRGAAGALARAGHLVISSWRPDRCQLSLYSAAEQLRLGGARLDPILARGRTEVFGLDLEARECTDWHEVWFYRRTEPGTLTGQDAR